MYKIVILEVQKVNEVFIIVIINFVQTRPPENPFILVYESTIVTQQVNLFI